MRDCDHMRKGLAGMCMLTVLVACPWVVQADEQKAAEPKTAEVPGSVPKAAQAKAVESKAAKAPAPKAAEAKATQKHRVLATVNGEPITEADIADAIAAQMMRIENQIYTVKKQALDTQITDRLLDAAAKKRGLLRPELLQKEVNEKVEAVSDDEIRTFYDANKARLGDKPLAEVQLQVMQQLRNDKLQKRQQEFLDSLRETATVKMAIKPPVVEVDVKGSPVRGPADAPVTIIEFSDFQCPYCVRAHSTLAEVRNVYKDKVKIIYKDFPLTRIHPQAQPAAEAARCAGDQGKYWEYHDMLFVNSRALDDANLKKYAADLSLDGGQFEACLSEGTYAAAVEADLAEGARVGVTGTPAFFINGRFLGGAQPLTAFQEVIDEELEAQK